MEGSISSILERFSGRRIVVWGDLILDEYVYTSSTRVSREAPVLVAEFESNEFRLGGAGNVVLNLLTLGAEPVPVGFIGADRGGKQLQRILDGYGICTGFLVELDGFHTPVKSRILSGGDNTRKQQVLRIDTLPRPDIPEESHRSLDPVLRKALKEASGLIISDYIARSVHPANWERVRKKGLSMPVMLDSRENIRRFPGVTVATPNEPEIRALFPERRFNREEDFIAAGSELREQIQAAGIVLKRGHRGMDIFEAGKNHLHIDISGTSQIVDGTGAGDTVMAVVSLGIASGADLPTAARLATIAAGIVVMKEGATPIGRDELKNAAR